MAAKWDAFHATIKGPGEKGKTCGGSEFQVLTTLRTGPKGSKIYHDFLYNYYLKK